MLTLVLEMLCRKKIIHMISKKLDEQKLACRTLYFSSESKLIFTNNRTSSQFKELRVENG